MGKWCNLMNSVKPTICMIILQISYTGVNVGYKLASNDGMKMPIMVAYRFMFAAATVVPLSLYFERSKWSKLTWMVVFQAFVCGMIGGSLTQNLYGNCLVMTSATFASAMTNVIPALTFILAIFFRLEKLQLKSMAGKAKVIGTLLCIGGAMLLTFYKGVEIKIRTHNFDLLKHNNGQIGHTENSHRKSMNHILGPILSLCSSFSSSVGLIVQAKMSERYPYHYSSTALISVMGFIQALVYCLCIERDWNQWKLGWNVRLLSVAYSGIVGSGLMIVVCMWCVRVRGPLFVSVFSPLMLVLVAIAGFLFLNEKLYFGSILGAMVIVCGLYSVLWGKSKDVKKITQLKPSRSMGQFGQHHQLDENMGTPETNKDSTCTSTIPIKGINVIGVAPTLLFTPEFVISDHVEEDIEVANSNNDIVKV